MYLARLSIGDEAYVQAVVQIDFVPASAPGGDGVRAERRRLAAALGALPHAWITQRLLLEREKLLRHWVVTAPASCEASLLRWCAGLTHLTLLRPGIARVFDDRRSHDEILDRCPGTPASVHLPVYEAPGCAGIRAGAWLGGSFLLAEHADDLMTRARLDGHRLLLQSTFTRAVANSERHRELLKNALRLTEIPGLGAWRQAAFDTVVRNHAQSTHRVAELVAADGPDAMRWLDAAVAQSTQDAPFPPELNFSSEHLGTLPMGIDLGDLHDPRLVALCSLPFQRVCEVLDWEPSRIPRAFLERTPADDDAFDDTLDQVQGVPGAGEGPGGDGDYVFVSYCRRDGEALQRLLNGLRSVGIRPWWDHRIPGGAEWLEVLERHVEGCRAVVALISGAAGRSRFVRNELSYAHIVGKPIIPVRIDDAPIASGLRFVLSHRHWLQIRDEGVFGALKAAMG